ncbi:MAG: hypothetical protein D0528_00865 [Methylococcales bacterium]|nr:MAG: hypothetical protein D0528_00865 [Methylococcales bacterium]
MRDEYDFSSAKRANEVPHLAKLQAESESGKSRITIFLDDVLAEFKKRASQSGKGYQTLINEALRHSIAPDSAPITVEVLRKILHEELHVA